MVSGFPILIITFSSTTKSSTTLEHTVLGCPSQKNNTISNNFIANNSYGIYIYGYSDANIIKNNNLTNNSYGLYIAYYSKLNQVEANNVYDSKSYGITLRNATNNFIFHNNFVNNHHQIDVIGIGTNTWHDGYPSGGNYWSDYKGKDQNSGVGQKHFWLRRIRRRSIRLRYK